MEFSQYQNKIMEEIYIWMLQIFDKTILRVKRSSLQEKE